MRTKKENENIYISIVIRFMITGPEDGDER